ncbi:MAG: proline racemase family protein [Phycisphaerales bacterium]|nr:proline racemase family protein [Phycisphaerales bacterium]
MSADPGRVVYRLGMDPVRVIDSHTEGEPTRVVIEGAPDLGAGSIEEKTRLFRTGHNEFRRAVACEPRGHEAIVGALLLEPSDPSFAAGVIFFNNVGTLHMCVHGAIGVTVTLAHLGRIGPGSHRLETSIGAITAHLGENGLVSVENVPSHRQRSGVRLDVEGLGMITGDIAWGGNWFFLVEDHGLDLASTDIDELRSHALSIRRALESAAIHGIHVDPVSGDETYQIIDHVELFDRPTRTDCDSRNFVLCPGGEFDRSPCGTGTSAKLACLHADGMLEPGQPWAQESIIGSRFTGRYHEKDGMIIPTITGGAWITADSTLLFDHNDPFAEGIIRS